MNKPTLTAALILPPLAMTCAGLLGSPPAHADTVAYLINVTVRPGYNFANADDALTYGRGVCTRIDSGQRYGDVMGQIKSDFNNPDDYQASYLINQAVNELCPALATAQVRGQLPAPRILTALQARRPDVSIPRTLLSALVLAAAAGSTAATANADNNRLNNSVIADIYAVQHQAGCTNDVKPDSQLRLAAQWHSLDVLNNRNLDADIGSDGSTPQDRANAAGYHGAVAETVAINPALAISGIELINQWYDNPDYHAIMANCANTAVGVWSENSLDRTVVVAVYGQPK